MAKAHPPELKAAAIATAAAQGVTRAAEAHGVSKATVSRWCSDAGVVTVPNEQTQAATDAARHKRERLRQQLNTRLLEKATDMLERMDHEHVGHSRGRRDREEPLIYDVAPADACRNYATAAAIMIDKSQLLSGEATSRGEHVSLEPLDIELRRLAAEVKARA